MDRYQSTLRARKILSSLNERLLLEIAKHLGVTEKAFWTEYMLSNIHQVVKRAVYGSNLKIAYEKVCADCDIDNGYDTACVYKFVVGELDHILPPGDGPFNHIQDVAVLEEEAKTVFGTRTPKQLASVELYLDLLELAQKVSQKLKKDLYE